MISTRVALIQHRVQDPDTLGRDPDIIEEAVRQAASQGAWLVVAPETCFYRYEPWEQNGVTMSDLAEHYDALKQRFSALAAELDINLVIGLRQPSGDIQRPVWNTGLFFGANGALLREQHKIVPSLAEEAWTLAGKPGVFSSPFGRTALMICKTAKTDRWSVYNGENLDLFILIAGDDDATSFTVFGDICKANHCYGILANQIKGQGNEGFKGNSAWGWPDGHVEHLGDGEGLFFQELFPACRKQGADK